MEDKIISYKTAVLAKKKGFTIPVFDSYVIVSKFNRKTCELKDKNLKDGDKFSFKVYFGDEGTIDEFKYNYNNLKSEYYAHKEYISAPTQSLLQKWIRETHKIHIMIIGFGGTELEFYTPKIVEGIQFKIDSFENFTKKQTSYEDALEMGLIEALNLIK
tara:strand:- start:215 stop:691 length:477 start_codon:yes stop_codon:yes gene_type:complete